MCGPGRTSNMLSLLPLRGAVAHVGMRNSLALAVLAAVLAAPSALWAHHGTYGYDREHLTTVRGTVTEFDLVNPHSLIHLAIKKKNGTVEAWTAETAPPNMLHRVGWDKTTLRPGDHITVTGYRAKDGARLLSVRSIVLPNGQQLNQRRY